MSEQNSKLRDFLFRGLLLEADADRFRRAGIEVGADISRTEVDLIREAIVDFPIALRNEALQMARLYCVVFCFENSVRSLIAERMQDLHGPAWWDTKVSEKLRGRADSRRKEAEKNAWLEGEKKDPLAFVDFGDLADIITSNWDSFEDVIPSEQWLTQRMQEMEQARNFIAHNRMLLPGEFERLYMYIRDWVRQVGI